MNRAQWVGGGGICPPFFYVHIPAKDINVGRIKKEGNNCFKARRESLRSISAS